jgi:hypothetical protein
MPIFKRGDEGVATVLELDSQLGLVPRLLGHETYVHGAHRREGSFYIGLKAALCPLGT